jgi:FixJ family two-component response regulator
VDWFKKEDTYSFSEKEKQVLDGIFQGKVSAEIASDMNVSPRTVESHRIRIIERTGSENIVGVLIKALKWGHLFRGQ